MCSDDAEYLSLYINRLDVDIFRNTQVDKKNKKNNHGLETKWLPAKVLNDMIS